MTVVSTPKPITMSYALLNTQIIGFILIKHSIFMSIRVNVWGKLQLLPQIVETVLKLTNLSAMRNTLAVIKTSRISCAAYEWLFIDKHPYLETLWAKFKFQGRSDFSGTRGFSLSFRHAKAVRKRNCLWHPQKAVLFVCQKRFLFQTQ